MNSKHSKKQEVQEVLDQTTDVHMALQEAVLEGQLIQDDSISIKINSQVKSKLQEVCKANGTTASAYLRKCGEALVRDLLPKTIK